MAMRETFGSGLRIFRWMRAEGHESQFLQYFAGLRLLRLENISAKPEGPKPFSPKP